MIGFIGLSFISLGFTFAARVSPSVLTFGARFLAKLTLGAAFAELTVGVAVGELAPLRCSPPLTLGPSLTSHAIRRVAALLGHRLCSGRSRALLLRALPSPPPLVHLPGRAIISSHPSSLYQSSSIIGLSHSFSPLFRPSALPLHPVSFPPPAHLTSRPRVLCLVKASSPPVPPPSILPSRIAQSHCHLIRLVFVVFRASRSSADVDQSPTGPLPRFSACPRLPALGPLFPGLGLGVPLSALSLPAASSASPFPGLGCRVPPGSLPGLRVHLVASPTGYEPRESSGHALVTRPSFAGSPSRWNAATTARRRPCAARAGHRARPRQSRPRSFSYPRNPQFRGLESGAQR